MRREGKNGINVKAMKQEKRPDYVSRALVSRFLYLYQRVIL